MYLYRYLGQRAGELPRILLDVAGEQERYLRTRSLGSSPKTRLSR
jgi:hypothetical protein